MLLAIDIGNTNTVFALYEGDALRHVWRCRTVAARSGDEYAAFLNELFSMEALKWETVADVIVASVVPDANFHLRQFCLKYLSCEPVFVNAERAGIEAAIDNPSEVGADRLVNAVAVRAFYSVPAVVIDFGTATTFDVIDAKGRYCGGSIAPGINLSVEALRRAAAKLPSVAIQKPDKAIGTNTVAAMQSGVFWGYKGLIEGLLTQITKEMGAQPFVLATGGLATLFSEHIDAIDAVDDELTLKGLLRIHRQPQKQ